MGKKRQGHSNRFRRHPKGGLLVKGPLFYFEGRDRVVGDGWERMEHISGFRERKNCRRGDPFQKERPFEIELYLIWRWKSGRENFSDIEKTFLSVRR